ncbi:MAG: hypothetical protein DHS20C17_31500 [Cyclobacteriaceae bacterium]|nr:MAG: hypothetical protein DHS20C17_31500 [Cyclobacteriaceae bacterium]
MFKKLLLALLLFTSFQTSYSQVLISLLFGDKLNSDKIEFGLEGGANFSRMSDFESTKYQTFFNLGFYFDIKLKDQWFIYTGVLVKSNTGLNKLSENDLSILDPDAFYISSGAYSQRISYFHIPVNIKHRFKNHFYLHAGPQVALRTKAFVKFEGEENNKTVEIKTENKDLFTRLEFGLIGGVGYKLKKGQGMNIGMKYFYGLTNIMKETPAARNRSIYLVVGIPIGRHQPDQ